MTTTVQKTKRAIESNGKEKMDSRELVKNAPNTAVSTYNAFDAYLDGVAAESAAILTFKKGAWATRDEDLNDRELVPHAEAATAGYVKWHDRRPVDEAMTPVIAGCFPPRETLGDADRDMWPIGKDGHPADPWQRTNKLPLKDPVSGETFIYTTSSRGGIDAIHKLLKAIRRDRLKGMDGLPIIRLAVDSYPHPDHGEVIIPSMPIVSWKSERELLGGEPDFDEELNDELPSFV